MLVKFQEDLPTASCRLQKHETTLITHHLNLSKLHYHKMRQLQKFEPETLLGLQQAVGGSFVGAGWK